MASPTSQFILQPFFRFFYVTNSPGEPPMARTMQSLGLQPSSLKSILISSSHLRFGLPKGLFPSGFPTKTMYAFMDCSIRATCPAHLGRLDLGFLKRGRRMIWISGFLIWSKTLMELIFNPCGEFR